MKVVGVLSSHTKEQLPPCEAYIVDFFEINPKFLTELMLQN